ncbi:hypothetical protein GEMRC1_013358 [Eukaryota sp. GEM-RC1]
MDEYRRQQHARWLQARGLTSQPPPHQQRPPPYPQPYQQPSQPQQQQQTSTSQSQLQQDEELARRYHSITSSFFEQEDDFSGGVFPIQESFGFPFPRDARQQQSRQHHGGIPSLFSAFDRMFRGPFERMAHEPGPSTGQGFAVFPGGPIFFSEQGPRGLYEMLSNLEPVSRPTNPEVAQQLPVIEFKGQTGPDQESSCSICLGEFQMGEQLVILPCGHRFHKECGDELFKRSSKCPNCRSEITV